MPAPALQSSARFQEWSNVHQQLLWSYRGAVHPKGRNRETTNTNLFGWLLLRGSCETTCVSGKRRAGRGEWMFPPFGPRHQLFSKGARIISICFRLDWPGGKSLIDPGVGVVLRTADFPDLEATANGLCEYLEAEFPSAFNDLFLHPSELRQHLEIGTLFAQWLKAYGKAMEVAGIVPFRPYEEDPRLARAMQLIEMHALNQPFREVTLARSVGISAPQLNRLFTRHLGMTPKERFEERRRRSAIALLEQTARPIKAVSADLGFSSPAHFSRWCVKALHLAPREFRRTRSL